MKRAFVVLLLTACGGAEPAPATPICPAGSSWNGSECAAMLDTSCPPGMRFVSARGCVPIVARQPPPPPPPPPPPNDGTAGVDRTVWIQRMISDLPPRVCAANYFQQCFVASRAACEASIAVLTQSCLRDRQATLPRFFDEASGRREGTKIGTCVGAAYEAQMRGSGRFVNSAACNDPSRW